jgi:hypothetical protein
MWTSEYQLDTELAPSAIWAALKDLHTGHPLSENSDLFEIHGPFEVGTAISVTPRGQQTFQSEIVELVEDERYADRTEFGGLSLLFRHTLTPLDGGGTRISHRLVIEGPEADQAGPELGPQITEDFPAAMADLVAAAARLIEN